MQWHIMLHCEPLHDVVLHYIIPYIALYYNVMLHYVMLHYIMLCYVMPCYAMLCYAMLLICYAMLCYAILCYAYLYLLYLHLYLSLCLACPGLKCWNVEVCICYSPSYLHCVCSRLSWAVLFGLDCSAHSLDNWHVKCLSNYSANEQDDQRRRQHHLQNITTTTHNPVFTRVILSMYFESMSRPELRMCLFKYVIWFDLKLFIYTQILSTEIAQIKCIQVCDMCDCSVFVADCMLLI